jgi:protein-disulfide isomerase-like protein with CxxC motif
MWAGNDPTFGSAKPAWPAKFGVREMASQIVMDRTGDTRHKFDNQDRAEVTKAKQRFGELTGAGFTAAVRSGLGEQRIIPSFDPTARKRCSIRV